MKKVLITLQILFVIIIAGYIIYTVSKPETALVYDPESWKSWDGFYVLSYSGITDKKDGQYVSPSRLKEQLQALKQAGYNTITPEDAAAFLGNRSPLPEKALMIIFEGGRKDNFIYSTPLLKRLGMRATMCVPVGFTGIWGTFYMNERDLKKLSKHENWSLCSMGDNAMSDIIVDKAGSKGHFLSRRIWLDKGPEDDAAYEKRVTKDYAKAASFVERITGKKTQAYLYPYADAGTGALADPLAFEVNRIAVSKHHDMAFTSAEVPFNGLSAAPYSLNRLRVSDDWDGERLVKLLNSFIPSLAPVEGLNEKDWFRKGDTTQTESGLTMLPGSSIWLRGSNYWSDEEITIKAHLTEKASLALFLRHEATDSYLRLSITQKTLSLNEQTGGVLQTLARTLIPNNGGDSTLRLRLKGTRAWVWYNDRLVAGSIPLSANIVRGKIGISCQNAKVEIMDVNAVPLTPIFVLSDNYRSLPSTSQKDISFLLPDWFSQGSSPAITSQQRSDLLVAYSNGVRTMPVIKAKGAMSVDEAENFSEAILSSLEKQSIKTLITHFALYGTDSVLPEALHKMGYSLVRILSADEALQLAKEKKISGEDFILIKEYRKDMKETINSLLHFLPPGRLIIAGNSVSGLPVGVSRASSFINSREEGAE